MEQTPTTSPIDPGPYPPEGTEPAHGWPYLYRRRHTCESVVLVEKVPTPGDCPPGGYLVVAVAGRGADSYWHSVAKPGSYLITSPASMGRTGAFSSYRELLQNFAPYGEPTAWHCSSDGLIYSWRLRWEDMPIVPKPEHALVTICDGDRYEPTLDEMLFDMYKRGEEVDDVQPVWATWTPVRVSTTMLARMVDDYFAEEGQEPEKALPADDELVLTVDFLEEVICDQVGGEEPETSFCKDEAVVQVLQELDDRVRKAVAEGQLFWGDDVNAPAWVAHFATRLTDVFAGMINEAGAYMPDEIRPAIPHDWKMRMMAHDWTTRQRVRAGGSALGVANFAAWIANYFPRVHAGQVIPPRRDKAPAAAFMPYFHVEAPVGAPWVAYCEAIVAQAIVAQLPNYPGGLGLLRGRGDAGLDVDEATIPDWVRNLYEEIDSLIDAVFLPARFAMRRYEAEAEKVVS